MSAELKTVIDQLGRDWQDFKSTNDQRLKAIEQGRSTAEIDAKLGRLEQSISDLSKAKDTLETERKALENRIDELEAQTKSGRPTGAPDLRKKHVDLFEKYLRARSDHGPEAQALKSFERQELKAITSTSTAASGGYAVPEEISRQIVEQMSVLSPVRNLVKVVQAGSPDYKELVAMHNESSGWAGETGTRSETNTPNFRERAPTFGTLYCYPKATEEALNDVFFNVGNFLRDYTSFEMAKAEGIAVISGNGTNKPTGLLNTTPVTTDDSASPERAAGALEYVPLDPGTSPSVGIQADALLDIVYTLRAPYRARASWAMNSLTVSKVRKLKDSNDQYLWQPSLAAGQPSQLLGYPVAIWEDLSNVALNANSILFGDFMQGYVLVDLVGLRISVDEITTPGYVKWYIRRRVGGCILDNNAIKVGRVAAA